MYMRRGITAGGLLHRSAATSRLVPTKDVTVVTGGVIVPRTRKELFTRYPPSEAILSEDVRLSPNDDAARRAAERTALTRMVIVIAVWLATWTLRQNGSTARLGLDVLLAAASWWAVLPGRRQGGSGFGEHGHWTSLLIAFPVGFGIATAVELWHLLRGGA